jgi:MoaA/NifB/PqqE/SkfB family radical SAM enzyme/pimeloyl-ACP methyl ester carboxylesterase
MRTVGIVLVHGYTGSSEDLEPLARQLEMKYGVDSVKNISLPGHPSECASDFDHSIFLSAILAAVETYAMEKRKTVLLGHSTGGSLVLSSLQDHSIAPDLLILAGVPKQIDGSYLARWNHHRTGIEDIPLGAVARMVSFVNAVGIQQFSGTYPVLIMHGEKDGLVPCDEAFAWNDASFKGPKRTVIVPFAEHALFRGPNHAVAIDVVMRAVSDVVLSQEVESPGTVDRLEAVEPRKSEFLKSSPLSERHLALSPSWKRMVGATPCFSPIVLNDPVMANIEITTHCNLSCKYCARAVWGRKAMHMPAAGFSRILELLPHAYRVTLVGLGEPLLHPQVVQFVGEASSQSRRVTIVTNAMNLDQSLSRALIRAGLDSIVFSLDAPNQNLASAVRAGTELNTVLKNIRGFLSISSEIRPVGTAVFSAVSVETTPYLVRLADLVSQLGVNVWMLSDLNYRQNASRSVWKNRHTVGIESVQDAVRYAFSKALPVLSVHALEEFGLAERYKQFLLVPPRQLCHRSACHTWCSSPWQTAPIDVGGNLTICDCQPEMIIGNLLTDPFSAIWNNDTMVSHRKRMRGSDPPEACRICPRF